jgi:hypothetical protein
MKDADLKHLTGYADELYEQGDKKTADLIYALVDENIKLRSKAADLLLAVASAEDDDRGVL